MSSARAKAEAYGLARKKGLCNIPWCGIDEFESQVVFLCAEVRRLYERGPSVHSFKELDPKDIQAILDATDERGAKLYPDVLTPLAKNEEDLFRRSPCPKCGCSSTTPTVNAHRPFTKSSPLPNKVLRCLSCSTEYDPRTGIITFANLIDVSG
jgi:hypothetical protein